MRGALPTRSNLSVRQGGQNRARSSDIHDRRARRFCPPYASAISERREFRGLSSLLNAYLDFVATASAASANGERSDTEGRFCESFGADSTDSSSGDPPHRVSGE